MLKGAHSFVESGFAPEVVLQRIEVDRATFVFAVPTMIYRLLDHVSELASDRAVDFSSLRTILYGAAPITPGPTDSRPGDIWAGVHAAVRSVRGSELHYPTDTR